MNVEEYQWDYLGKYLWERYVYYGCDLWQSKPGRDWKEDGEMHRRSTANVNVAKLLKLRETGPKPLLQTRALRNRALARLLKDRWQRADRLTVFQDATKLLDRKLYFWEGRVIDHLLGIGSRFDIRVEENKQLMSFISRASHLGPVSFCDILEIVHFNGADFNRTDEYGTNVLVYIFETKSLLKDMEEAVYFLVGHGLDVNRLGHAALMEFRDRLLRPNFPIGLGFLLKVLKVLLQAGFLLKHSSYRDSLRELLSTLSKVADEHAVEIFQLFIDYGFGVEHCFEAHSSFETLFACLGSAEKFRNVLDIFRLLHKSDSPPPCFDNDEEKKDMLRLFSKSWCELEDLSLSDLICRCTETGIHLKALNCQDMNLLMAVCRDYKGNDLADVVHLLCKTGSEVNHLDTERKNALVRLSENQPNSRQSVYDAARVLIESGIDVNQVDIYQLNAFLSFIYKKPTKCCRYGDLLDLNQSHFWDTLNLLIDSGTGVNQVSKKKFGSTLIYKILKLLVYDWQPIFCFHCTRSYCIYTNTYAEQARDPGYFQGVLGLIRRLLAAGASTKEKTGVESDSVLFFVCAYFKGDELVALVKLLCECGINVNAKTSKYGTAGWSSNAMEVLKLENPSQISVLSKIEHIMKLKGFAE